MWLWVEVHVGESTRPRNTAAERAVEQGAAATAPTAPHATPPRQPSEQRTGPARFWSSRRVHQGLAIGFVLSAAFHYVISPFSLMPSGPPIDFHEQAGDLTIPVDLITEVVGDKPGTGTGSQNGGTTGTSAGLTDGGARDGALNDSGALIQGVDGGSEDAATEDDGGNGGVIAIFDGGGGRDPQSLLGVAGSVSAGPNNITLMVNFAELRKHPESARLGLVLGGIPQWRAFMSNAQGAALLDPMRDADWMIIMGPSFIDTQNDAVYIHYSTPDAQVDKVIDTVSRQYPKGGPIDLGVHGVRAWKGFADKGERVFLRPRPHIAVIVPADHAQQFARVLAQNPIMPHVHAGEAMSLRALRPGGSSSAVPQDISEMRLWITPRASDGGGDLYVEGDCPSDAAAQTDAEAIKALIKQKNSFAVRLLTAGFFTNVIVTTAGNQVHLHISATQEQIEALLALAAGLVHVTLPPQAHGTLPTPPVPSSSASD